MHRRHRWPQPAEQSPVTDAAAAAVGSSRVTSHRLAPPRFATPRHTDTRGAARLICKPTGHRHAAKPPSRRSSSSSSPVSALALFSFFVRPLACLASRRRCHSLSQPATHSPPQPSDRAPAMHSSRLVTTSLTPVLSACGPSPADSSSSSATAAMSAAAPPPRALEATDSDSLAVPSASSCSHKRSDADAAAAASSSSATAAAAAAADSAIPMHPMMAGHFAQLSLNHYNGTAPAPSPSPANSPIAPYDMTPMSFKRHKIEVLNAGRLHDNRLVPTLHSTQAPQSQRPHASPPRALLLSCCVSVSPASSASISASS